MYASNRYVIYEATASDAVKLWYLSQLTGQPRLRDRAVIGDIQGVPAAAISVADDRIVTDLRRDTTRLTPLLRSRARSLRELERTPSLPARLRRRARPPRIDIGRISAKYARSQLSRSPANFVGALRTAAAARTASTGGRFAAASPR